MRIVKKEIPFILLTCALGITTLLADVIKHPLSYPSGNETYSILLVLSGYQGYLFSIMGGLALFSHPSWVVFVTPFLAWFCFPITMFFSKKIFVVKRIAFSYFITMYMVVILFYFFDYLIILGII